MRDIATRLKWLESCAPGDVRAEWLRIKGTPPPLVPTSLLRQLTAYAVQEKRWRGLPAATRRTLHAPSDQAAVRTLAVRPGTRLVRSWNGQTVSVLATETGFLWNDQSYRSLSQIAREVTGARWSGPRFFGLNEHG
jgi:hypothetical protein